MKQKELFIVNIALLVSGIAMSISGLIIQCYYHVLKNTAESCLFALDRMDWNAIHIWTSLAFLIAVIYHVWAHRKWYANVLKRHLLARHRPTMLLTALTFAVVVSGFIPLFILYSEGSLTLRFSIIEVHDKIAIFFFIVLLRHTIKRFKWYATTRERIFGHLSKK